MACIDQKQDIRRSQNESSLSTIAQYSPYSNKALGLESHTKQHIRSRDVVVHARLYELSLNFPEFKNNQSRTSKIPSSLVTYMYLVGRYRITQVHDAVEYSRRTFTPGPAESICASAI